MLWCTLWYICSGILQDEATQKCCAALFTNTVYDSRTLSALLTKIVSWLQRFNKDSCLQCEQKTGLTQVKNTQTPKGTKVLQTDEISSVSSSRIAILSKLVIESTPQVSNRWYLYSSINSLHFWKESAEWSSHQHLQCLPFSDSMFLMALHTCIMTADNVNQTSCLRAEVLGRGCGRQTGRSHCWMETVKAVHWHCSCCAEHLLWQGALLLSSSYMYETTGSQS